MIGKYADRMTFDVILKRMLARVPDSVDKREGSVIYDALAPAAAELAKTYMELDVVMDETFVDTASLQYLILRCKERGVPVLGETAAIIQAETRPVMLELQVGTRFRCGAVNYAVKEKMSPGLYRLESETPGTEGNQYTGTLIPIQSVNGLQSAEIKGVLIPGENGDTTETLRERYYASIDGESFGGNVADYKETVNALHGVGGVKVYPVWNGGGTVKLTVISSDYTVPSEELIAAVQQEIDPQANQGEGLGLAPIGHSVTVAGVKDEPVSITTRLTFIDGWRWEDAREQVELAVRDYFAELAAAWADADATVIRIAQIETRILALSCVLDIADTALNGQTKNVQITTDHIPSLKKIEVVV